MKILSRGIRRIVQSHPRTLALFVGGFITFILVCCAEGSFYLLNQRNAFFKQNSEEMFQSDKLLGYIPKPDIRVHSKKTRKKGGKSIYDVIYSIDQYSRRVTPVENLLPKTGFILYFGGSFIFGEGVNDDETMPFYVSQRVPQYQPYNYGFSGYGPQQMFAKLLNGDITEEVNHTGRGILVYTFISDHVRRVIGSMQVLYYARYHPYYTLDRDDRLVRKGSFQSGRSFLTTSYRAMSKSQTLGFFRIDFQKVNENHILLTARIISESRRIFSERFDSDEFYVLIHPGANLYGKRLISYLQQLDVKYLDYSGLPSETFPYDGHPTAKTHQAIAERIVKDLLL